MEQKLTISEITYIRNLAEHKTDEELAKMISKPVALVQMQLSLISDFPRRPWEKRPWENGAVQTPPATAKVVKPPKKAKAAKKQKQPKAPKPKLPKAPKKGKKLSTVKRISHAERKVIREKKNADMEKEKREKLSAHAVELQQREKRKRKLEKEKFKTLPAYKPGTVQYKLNSKTIIWDKPDADIAELKKKYNIV